MSWRCLGCGQVFYDVVPKDHVCPGETVTLPRFTLAELFGRDDEQLRLAIRQGSLYLDEEEGRINRDVVDPEQPGASFWPASIEEHRVLLAQLEAELKAALATIRSLHRCPHCDRPLTAAGEAR